MASKMAVGQLTESLGVPEAPPHQEAPPTHCSFLDNYRPPNRKVGTALGHPAVRPFLCSALKSHWRVGPYRRSNRASYGGRQVWGGAPYATE